MLGDHADVIGHYRRVEAPPGSGRRYVAYDLLRSSAHSSDDPGFADAMFARVWNDVFAFCAGEQGVRA